MGIARLFDRLLGNEARFSLKLRCPVCSQDIYLNVTARAVDGKLAGGTVEQDKASQRRICCRSWCEDRRSSLLQFLRENDGLPLPEGQAGSVVKRIGRGTAVLASEGGFEFTIPSHLLPLGTKAGSHLTTDFKLDPPAKVWERVASLIHRLTSGSSE